MSEHDEAVSIDPSAFMVSTMFDSGQHILKVDASINSREGWAAFCATLNAQALALWPEEPDEPEELEPEPRRTRTQLQGEPKPGSFDAQVLELARKRKFPPDFVASAAEALNRKPLLIRVAVGRLKARGVWADG